MNDADLVEKLSGVVESDAVALDALTQELLQNCREASRTIIGEWLEDNGSGSAKAAFVAGQIHELALYDMLNRVQAVSPDLRVDLMATVLDAVVQLRNLLLGELVPLLDVLTPIDAPLLTRACDAAYVLICKVEGRAKDTSEERIFWDLSKDDRDREIANWRVARAKASVEEDEFA